MAFAVFETDVVQFPKEGILPNWRAYTVQEASEISGYHAEYIRRLCRYGKLEFSKIGHVYLIKADSLDAYIEEMKARDDGRTGPKSKS